MFDTLIKKLNRTLSDEDRGYSDICDFSDLILFKYCDIEIYDRWESDKRIIGYKPLWEHCLQRADDAIIKRHKGLFGNITYEEAALLRLVYMFNYARSHNMKTEMDTLYSSIDNLLFEEGRVRDLPNGHVGLSISSTDRDIALKAISKYQK